MDGSEPYSLGTTTIVWTATDGSGNTASCSQFVTVQDNEDPTITCPSNITVDTDTGVCTASGVSLGASTETDNCSVTVSNDGK